jgi:hypothetical protein
VSKMSFGKLTALALLVPCAPLFAHHGTAGSYDQNKVVKVQGVVKEFWWRNPHSALFVDGKDDAGKQATYALEMGSPQTLVKFGYNRTTFKPGDQVVISMHPSFSNPANGELLSGHFWVNGKELHSASAPANENY